MPRKTKMSRAANGTGTTRPKKDDCSKWKKVYLLGGPRDCWL